MKKWIIGAIVFIFLIVVGYGVYLFVFVLSDRDKCMQYSLNHPYVRCSYEDHDGKTRYCRKVRCFRSKTISENCIFKIDCKD